jgi:hypothetical protein
MSNKEAVLVFNKNRYQLDRLILLGKAGSTIAVGVADINPFSETKEINPDHVVTIENSNEPIDFTGPLYFKQHGKYTVIIGQNYVTEAIKSGKAMIKGRLISTPALKSVRINPEQPVPVAVIAPTYPPAFSNRPRFEDRRTPREFNSGSNFNRK